MRFMLKEECQPLFSDIQSAYTLQKKSTWEFVFFPDSEKIVIGSREPFEIGLFLDFDRIRMY